MTRKDYELIASALRESRPSISNADAYGAWVRIVDAVADKLRTTNPRFDFTRFIEACDR